jgi:hypothetical protein
MVMNGELVIRRASNGWVLYLTYPDPSALLPGGDVHVFNDWDALTAWAKEQLALPAPAVPTLA